MKFEILKDEDNRLLNRKQFMVNVTDITVTPKREDIWKKFAAKQGMDEKRLVIDTIYSQTGLWEVKFYAKYYDDEASLKRIEVKNNLAKLEKLLPKPKAPEKKAKEDAPSKEPASETVAPKEKPKEKSAGDA